MGAAIGDTLTRESCDRRACYPCDDDHGRACGEPWRMDAPAPTVTTMDEKGTRANAVAGWTFNGGPDRASDAAFLVAGIRRIDLGEGLRLQGLPDDWPLQGTVHDRYVQVGNAVPPPLAEACGRLVAGAHRAWSALRATGLDPAALADALRRNRRSRPPRSRAMTPCPCSQPMPAPGNHKAARRVTIDRAALRRELGDVPEIREAMIAKGAGRPSANHCPRRPTTTLRINRGWRGLVRPASRRWRPAPRGAAGAELARGWRGAPRPSKKVEHRRNYVIPERRPAIGRRTAGRSSRTGGRLLTPEERSIFGTPASGGLDAEQMFR